MIKQILLLFLTSLIILTVISCSNRNAEPVGPKTDITSYEPGENPLGYFTLDLIGGGPLEQATGEAVIDNDLSEAVISLDFNSHIDTSNLAQGITMQTTSGTEITLVYESRLGPHSSIDIKPATDLAYNRTYIFSLNGNLLTNIAGDKLDLDGDHKGGETPDDCLTYRFTTIFDNLGAPGDPDTNTTDDLAPVASNFGYYLKAATDGADSIVFHKYVDVNLRVFVYDKYRNSNGNLAKRALDAVEFDRSTVILRDALTKKNVLGVISYDSVYSGSDFFWRVSFNPVTYLAPMTKYELVLKAEVITDDLGNKLNRTSDISYSFTTTNTTSQSINILEDAIAPTVLSSSVSGTGFVINFSEEIDVSTINFASIEVTHLNQPYEGSFVIKREVYAPSPTGFATVVRFVPNVYRSGNNLLLVRSYSIKDLFGNVMEYSYTNFF